MNKQKELNLDMPKAVDHYQGRDLLDILIKHDVPFPEGNIIKYVFRWKRKGGLADLNKAKDYLEELIKKAENS